MERTRQKFQMIPLAKIIPNPSQPRKRFDSNELCALADSIKENGIIQPLILRRTASAFILIAGERRLRAAKIAGLREVPAIIADYSTRESAVVALIENLQRQDLSIFEEAHAISSLLREWGLTQEEAARRLGMSQSALANKLRILRLTGREQRLIEENNLTERHARALIRIDESEDRIKLLEAVIKNGLNVRKTEELIEKILNPEKEAPKPIRKGIIPRDIRLFINTIDHAVSTMLTAGIEARSTKKETEDYIECIVRIPKKPGNFTGL